MAAVRGRKRTEDPTPNRARDIQRAFRARRAAHLESLEERIQDLEEENNYFRALLNMPPSSRPALGKGPTGRGLAKSRSRIAVDGFTAPSDSPTPSSDSPTTPTLECPIPLSAHQADAFPHQLPIGLGAENEGDSRTPFSYDQSNKVVDPHQCANSFTYNAIHASGTIGDVMNALPADFESVSLTQAVSPVDPTTMHQGTFSNDYHWLANGTSINMPITPDEMHPNSMNQRAFSYTQQTAMTTINPRVLPHQFRPIQGHRRAHTEPHSLGSLVAGFSPTHRPSTSETAFVSTPSPPPLPIRATYPAYQ